MLPEPYWDFNMGLSYNYNLVKQYLNKAIKIPLKDEE
jgi:hypothetical protein